eukprot:NODE_223_length_3358_cov_5.037450.p1 GENE.NODE_223_length_3358_cov_5.037450~~NODE_223_length_3358_cov_5.037450.p1  ORF type:complete len:1013 (+),score=329.58 NODE_223_length_3358_cov_5.037450:334-3039(+)
MLERSHSYDLATYSKPMMRSFSRASELHTLEPQAPVPMRGTGIEVRDEVWWRLKLAQQKVQERTSQIAGASAQPHGGEERVYEPSGSWARGAGCRGAGAVGSWARAAGAGGSSGAGFGSGGGHRSAHSGPVDAAAAAWSGRDEPDELVHHLQQFMHMRERQQLWQQQNDALHRRLATLTAEWQHGEISNFAYIQVLNALSGRSLEDLAKYPVTPWVLREPRSSEAPSSLLARAVGEEVDDYLRDVSRTLGDQGAPERRTHLSERYQQGLHANADIPAFHYGSHFSSPATVMNFLIRMEPFTSLARTLQGGRYDVADRIFSSLPDAWRSCFTEMSDVRELIPEFFSLPECLMNIAKLPFGHRQDGTYVSGVALPTWAKDAYHFVHEHRLTLESAPVSDALNGWVDLIYGFKQRGQNAVDALNVYYHVTYDSFDWADVVDPDRQAMEQQVKHFGQTSRQLFKEPHPCRHASAHMTSLLRPSGLFREGWTPSAPSGGVSSWRSSQLALGSSQAGSSMPRMGGYPSTLEMSNAPIVSLSFRTEAGATRLFALRASGFLSCYRMRHPDLFGGKDVGAAHTFMTGAFRYGSSEPPAGAPTSRLQLEQEPGCAPLNTGEEREVLVVEDGLASAAAAWAFLPERRFFARGGYHDGHIAFGSFVTGDAHVVPRAHAAPVSAVAASQEAALAIPDSCGLLLLVGALDGSVSLWAAESASWASFTCLARWRCHLAAVRCAAFEPRQPWLAATCGDDGLANIYTLRPPAKPIHTFAFPGDRPIRHVCFGSRAPATLVASAGNAAEICVWSLCGYLLAFVALDGAAVLRGMRVISDGDALEAVLCAAADGTLELRSLPYLGLVWQHAPQQRGLPTTFDNTPARRIAWVGFEDGSFAATYVDGRDSAATGVEKRR